MRAADRPSLIIPVEVASREFDGKLLLACLAAQRGFTAYLGCRWRLLAQMHRLPPSIFLHKDVSRRALRIFDLLPPLGHVPMAWDEEALVYMSPDIYRRLKLSPASLAAPRLLFAWGEDNAEIWRGSEGYAGQPIALVGNPRVDLMRPEIRGYYAAEASRIRDRFGSFVLINSNFGWVNHYSKAIAAERMQLVGTEAADLPPERIGTWSDPGMLTFRYDVFRAFLDMLPRLAARFPDRAIVVRPHPSESQEAWQRAAAGRPNVHVVLEGGVAPWLLAAEAVIQNGCTTGVEACLLGRPTIAYQPLRDPVYEIRLPNELSVSAATVEELGDLVARAFRGDLRAADGADQPGIIRRHIASVEGALAGDRILDAVERTAEAPGLFERRPLSERLAARLDCMLRVVKRRLRLSGSHRSGQDSYVVDHIFPELPVDEVRDRIGRLREASGRFGDIAVARCDSNLFKLAAA